MVVYGSMKEHWQALMFACMPADVVSVAQALEASLQPSISAHCSIFELVAHTSINLGKDMQN